MNNSVDYGRRDFFTKIAMASLACYIPGSLLSCKDSGPLYTGSGKVPFKVWEEMLQAVMASPDYLPGRMERLIKNKDPKAMYHFVKDEIALIPNNPDTLSGLGKSFKWGIAGALRCGMATPREKAELLHLMYSKAGIPSKVVYERTSITREEVPYFFWRPIQRNFEPQVSKAQVKQWKEAMGISDVEVPSNLLEDYTVSAQKLSDKIIDTLQINDAKIKKFDFRWDNYRTPTVEFEMDGTIQYAHLFDPKTEFGALRNSSNTIGEAEPVQENKEEISVAISCRKSNKTSEEISLVSGTWKAKDLVGKQLILQFMHGLTPEEQLITTVNQLRSFTPVLAVQDFLGDNKALEERSTIGDTFTLEGHKIKLDETAEEPTHIAKFLEKPKPNLQTQVAAVSLSAHATNFPTVSLQIDARDADGNMIEGLSPKDFIITEDGVPVRAIMEYNQRTPRILVLGDESGSMPSSYRTGGMEKFTQDLKAGILSNFPAAEVDFWGTTSNLFTYLLKAARTSYDLIVYATDGHNSDKYQPENQAIFEAGPPALVLNVVNTTSKHYLETFEKMAEITGGKVMNAQDQELVLGEIITYINDLDPYPYSFSFGSSDKEKPHTVQVTIDNGRIKKEAQYQFPKGENSETNAIIGVYMTLKIGRSKAVKRVLAGWDPVYRYDSAKSETFARESKQLFLGGSLIAIEGAGPTRAMAFHDFLKSKLSHREWGEALIDGNIELAKEIQQKGVKMLPATLIPLMEPLQEAITETSFTFPSGYRIGMLTTSVGINGGKTIFGFDYLPTSRYRTLAVSKQEAFNITIKKTAQLAAREAVSFTESTLNHLQQKSLFFHGKKSREWLKDRGIAYSDIDYSFWNEKILRGSPYYKITDTQAQTKAFWQISMDTGELYGILPDGTGGGKTPSDETIDGATNIINLLMAIVAVTAHIASMFGGAILSPTGGLALGVVAKYGVTLVKLYAIVSEAILIMDTSGMNEKIQKELQTLACNVSKEVLFNLTGKAGAISGGLDNLIGMMVPDDKNPFACK